MDTILNHIKNEIYNKCDFTLSNLNTEPESAGYDACNFDLSGRKIRYRNAKTTPKKIGQFVTFWKRNENGPIEPFHETDYIDFYVVTVQKNTKLGQFVFPKSILITKEILSTDKKEGKRAFRVYTIWDTASNVQARQTQKWQLNYFYEINASTDIDNIKMLYNC